MLKILNTKIIFVDWKFKVTWRKVINMLKDAYEETLLYSMIVIKNWLQSLIVDGNGEIF